MCENKHHRPANNEKSIRSSHALIDRTLLKDMQSDISHASELIIALRDEKEKFKKEIQQLRQENTDKNNIIRVLKNKLKYQSNCEEDEDIIKELSQAKMKLKSEIEISMHGISPKSAEKNNEIISLTEYFLNKTHDKQQQYQIFKYHMKSSTNFKQIIGNESWFHATLLLLRFYKDLFIEDQKIKDISSELNSDESEQENYKNLIQESKNLLDTLSYQKNKLENLNKEFSVRGTKMSGTGSPLHRASSTYDKIIGSPETRKDISQLSNFHTSHKLMMNHASRHKQGLKNK